MSADQLPNSNGEDRDGAWGTGARDARMLRRAVEDRWLTTSEMRATAVRRVNNILLKDDASETAHLSAIHALLNMEKQNQNDQHLFAKTNRTVHHEHEFIAADQPDEVLNAVIAGQPIEGRFIAPPQETMETQDGEV